MSSIVAIRDAVAAAYGIEPGVFLERWNEASVVEARHVGIFLARRHTDASLEAIGRRFGRSSHHSCIHALDRVGRKLLKDAGFRDRVAAVEARLSEAGPDAILAAPGPFEPGSQRRPFREAVIALLEADDAISLAAGAAAKAAARSVFDAALANLRDVFENQRRPA